MVTLRVPGGVGYSVSRGRAGGFEGWAQSEAGFNINEGMVFTSGLQDTRRTASEALHNSSGLLRKEVERKYVHLPVRSPKRGQPDADEIQKRGGEVVREKRLHDGG